jgi:RNA polymerase sigma factor (sigma-70 family)
MRPAMNASGSLGEALRELAAEQYGFVTHAQAPAAGVAHTSASKEERMTTERNALQAALDRLSEPLTERQREVAGLVERGLTNEEIGAQLGISARTVKAHTDVIRRKLGVRRRRQIPPALRERERRG